MKLKREDLDLSCVELAKFLLGKILVRKLEDGTLLKGKVVETESYLGGSDRASHSFNGRKTVRNEPMYMVEGTCYVYFTYGMYHCFNISSREPGAAVLIRALEPIQGVETMHEFRNRKIKTLKELKKHELCNGPSKLCISLDISKENCNKVDLCCSGIIWIESLEQVEVFDIISCARIGIASAGEEWSSKPLRFYIYNNKCVSKRDKRAEHNVT